MIKGEIKEGRGGFYTVRDETGQEHILRAKKKFRRDGISPLPGDRVMLSPGSGEEHGWLEEILPRASLCLRPPVANITLMVIVIAPEPVPDYLLVDKLLVYADMQGIRPLIAVNKSDISMETYEKARDIYKSSGAPVIALSASSGQGLDELCSRMRGASSPAARRASSFATLFTAPPPASRRSPRSPSALRRGSGAWRRRCHRTNAARHRRRQAARSDR